MQWNDLDYADKRRVFTFDPQRFGDLPEMVKEFHQLGMKYVLILVSELSKDLTSTECREELSNNKVNLESEWTVLSCYFMSLVMLRTFILYHISFKTQNNFSLL